MTGREVASAGKELGKKEETRGLCLKLNSRFCPAVYKKPKGAQRTLEFGRLIG